MSTRARLILFFAGLVPLVGWLTAAVVKLPRSGTVSSLYGDLLVGAAAPERHATDVVTAVNFDYRGFDTLGEEFILFASVLGVLVLLRKSDETPGEADSTDQDRDRPAPEASDAVRVLGLALVGFTITFGLYIITHGQLTPGGGFQGGVIVATAWTLLYIAGTAGAYQRLTPKSAVEAIESAGAAAYALIGAGGLILGIGYLANFLPLGKPPSVLSGGTIPLLSFATGLEVTGGFILLVRAFLEEALAARQR